MIPGIPLAFAEPLLLLGLLSLPVLWWLLRLVPPRPRRIEFPPARILFDIMPREETPARTPWWLTALRLTLAGLVILAAAGPLWNPPVAATATTAPLVLLIDDGFGAANSWDARVRTAQDLIARAESGGRGVAVVPVSGAGRDISLETPQAARSRLRLVEPRPHAVDRSDVLGALERFLKAAGNVEIVWLSDGVDAGRGSEFVTALARLAGNAPVTVVDGGLTPARALAEADNAAGMLGVKVLRAADGPGSEAGLVRALDLKGLPLGEAPFTFAGGATETQAQFDLPLEIRNDIARLEIAGERSAGAVQLLDKRWRRRTVGVVTGSTADTAQPLLAGAFYLSRALSPFADVRLVEAGAPSEAVRGFIDQRLPMMILADVGTLAPDVHERLARWVEEGGVLVRFAGPRLAAADDDLVPVRLRRGGRILGGSLSWEQPQHLAGFSHDGPFGGMAVPDDVTVNRQVLAEPDAGLAEHTWAALGDGTPLVTAGRKGKGMMVLFHVTADTRWSDLPLSGSFVDMLRHVVGMSGALGPGDTTTTTAAAGPGARDAVAPNRLLDGHGAFGPPPPSARPVPAGYAGRATADNPPGFYGPPEGLVAVNTLVPGDRLAALDFAPLNARLEHYRVAEPRDLRGPLLLTALSLLLADALAVLLLAGGLRRLWPRRGLAAGVVIAAALATLPFTAAGTARAADAGAEQFAEHAALETRLAYVVTGDSETDAVSKSGLTELTNVLARRTALEAGDPTGVDIEHDELAFFPVIYWPIVPGARKPSPEALAHVDAYMKQGGTVLFDTRDAVLAIPGNEQQSPGMTELRNILSSLDIPELEPVPRDHVLTKTFFLLRDFPGRFTTGQLWVEALPAGSSDDGDIKRPARGGDGVSSIIITSNDFAGAWATRPDGQPMLPLEGGETRHQREMAFRAGVNIVMYTLTGNYKADQVHVPALLERLGQ